VKFEVVKENAAKDGAVKAEKGQPQAEPIAVTEPQPPKRDDMEQIRTMIQRFMREGYRNPALNHPTYARNGIELQDVRKLKQANKVLEYELDHLLSMMESAR
jgi:hypothetical protein